MGVRPRPGTFPVGIGRGASEVVGVLAGRRLCWVRGILRKGSKGRGCL